jgi:hypothetical protein
MKIGAIATGGASYVTLGEIFQIIAFHLVKFSNAVSVFAANTRRHPRKRGRVHPFE